MMKGAILLFAAVLVALCVSGCHSRKYYCNACLCYDDVEENLNQVIKFIIQSGPVVLIITWTLNPKALDL